MSLNLIENNTGDTLIKPSDKNNTSKIETPAQNSTTNEKI